MKNPLLNILKVPQTYPQTDEYPPTWKAIATELKEEANWTCEQCGHHHQNTPGKRVTVHHKDGVKSNCTPSNLIVLCQGCHLIAQALVRQAKKQRELERLGQTTFCNSLPGIKK